MMLLLLALFTEDFVYVHWIPSIHVKNPGHDNHFGLALVDRADTLPVGDERFRV